MNPPVWLWIVLTVGLVLNGLRLRGRIGEMEVLKPAPPQEDDGRFVFLVAEGVELDGATRNSAQALAGREGLEMVDLVPADYPPVAALDLLRVAEPKLWRTHPFAVGRGTGQALLASAAAAARAKLDPAGTRTEAQLAEQTIALKDYTPKTACFAVAPRLRAGPWDLGKRRDWLEAHDIVVGGTLLGPIIVYALLVWGVAAVGAWGFAAAAAWLLQPFVVFAGGPLTPPGLTVFAVTRPALEPLRWVGTATRGSGERRRREAAEFEAAKTAYAPDIEKGVDRFLEPRREDCPWCGGAALKKLFTIGDRNMRKPGRFTLAQCRSCNHIFQNPRLTFEGLDFYYRDFYDGWGPIPRICDFLFRTEADAYEGRAEILRPFTKPVRWLDTGTGHGHFCLYARETWPDTVFDGLDMTDAVDEAQARGWIDYAYKGQFTEMVDKLRGKYDVVSMHHYFEHTPDPFAELDAAREVLNPGGYLLIEVPDPEWRLGRALGRFWFSWFQPQHLHLAPLGNLKQALRERGFTPVAEDRGSAHQSVDLAGAALQFTRSMIPNYAWPWATDKKYPWNRLRRTFAFLIGGPLALTGLIIDLLITPLVKRGSRGNCYRVLARRDDPAPAQTGERETGAAEPAREDA